MRLLISQHRYKENIARTGRHGFCVIGSQRQTAEELKTLSPSGYCAIFQRRRTHGVKWTNSDWLSESTKPPTPGCIRFNALCEYYLKADFGGDAVRPKSDHSAPGCNLENLSREKTPSRKEAGSRPYIDMGKAEDTGEEPGICTQWDRRGRGSGN
jgi:hypothetical protein